MPTTSRTKRNGPPTLSADRHERSRLALERWADEEAGAAVADRQLVARAVARAALATKRAPVAAMAATGGPVPQRVKALLAPPTPLRRDLVMAFATLMVVCCASLGLAAHDIERLFEAAMPSHTTAQTR